MRVLVLTLLTCKKVKLIFGHTVFAMKFKNISMNEYNEYDFCFVASAF